MATNEALTSCTPNLMPFHIKYNGTAPISMYMRVEERTTDNLEAPAADATEASDTNANPEKSILRQAASYLASAFRGRTIHGTRVELPAGYGGVVLRSKDVGGKAPPPSQGRTRRSKPAEEQPMDVDADVEEALAPTVTATFSSFNLWLPDHLGRERDDEYGRALKEWIPVSEMVHWVPPEEQETASAVTSPLLS